MIVETLAALALAAPADVQACVPTKPNLGANRYGTSRLWTQLPFGGILRSRRAADGSLFNKLAWIPDRVRSVALTVSGRRLDAPGRMVVLSVNLGYSSGGRASWASAVTFPKPGCWRLTGRAGPTTLSYVVRVVPR